MTATNSELGFPKDFLFGVSTSAYQTEGGHESDGKGPNMYDYYCHKFPETFHNASNGDIASNSYNKWKEDIELLKELGVDFYRFSISWNRILPNGYANKINPAGIKHYNDIINELLKYNIEPMVTMHHYDLPLSLAKIGGWTNSILSDCFLDYAKVLFSNFGDRVKYWCTINTASSGYADGDFPPYINQPGIADYMSMHNIILAHAKAYRWYQSEFQKQQKGKIGFVIDARWYQPATEFVEDIKTTKIVLEFEVGIWLNPIFHPNGDYPDVVKKRVEDISKIEGYPRSRLPKFTPEEIEFVKGSGDFIGANLYTAFLVKHKEDSYFNDTSSQRDEGAFIFQDETWKKSASSWLKVYPETAPRILKWLQEQYNNPQIFITENGFSDEGTIDDIDRIDYLHKYLSGVLEAIKKYKVDVKGYSLWSLLDNFEWIHGYSERFGIHHVDFNDPDRKRVKKKSAIWYKNVVKQRKILNLDEINFK